MGSEVITRAASKEDKQEKKNKSGSSKWHPGRDVRLRNVV